MKMTSSTTKVLISIIMALSLVYGAESLVGKAVACELAEQGWEIPDLEGLKAELEETREQKGKKYKTEAFILNNTLFVGRLSCEGNVFTYVFDENIDGKIDFWIVDGDGDGIFETLCYPDDEAIIPEWVKK
ncbi:MAG: hypothetical protein PVJ69_15470 [Desulfobacteraceae bacterium]|jgi:hypothetical protein